MKKYLPVVILLSGIVLSGCVKILNEDITAKESKLVLNAAVLPDSVFEINLSRTFNIFENEDTNRLPFIDDATVKLFQNGSYLFDLENIGAGYYRKEGFYPTEGNHYTVTADKEGFKNIESSTTIPHKVPIIGFDTVTEDYGYGYSTLYGLLTFQDPKESRDYYLISAQVLFPGDEFYGSSWSNLDLWPPLGLEKLYENSYGALLWSDKYTEGKEVTLRFGFFYSYAPTGGGDSISSDTVRFRFFLKHITEAYFNYNLTYNTYRNIGSGDPFTEPVVVYSNVTNGYGILGSYSQDTVNLRIPFKTEGKKGGNR